MSQATRYLLPATVYVMACALGCSPTTREYGSPTGGGGAGGSITGGGGSSSSSASSSSGEGGSSSSSSSGAGGQGGAAMECVKDIDCLTGPNQTGMCVGGKCQIACEAAFLDCDAGAPGCETQAGTDKDCSACGEVCATVCGVTGGNPPAFYCNDPIDVTAGFQHTCAIRKDGSVWCWGSNESGEIGIGNGPLQIPAPVPVPLPQKAVKVAAGGGDNNKNAHTCAILEDKSLYCWGSGNSGQLGTGLQQDFDKPQLVMGISNVIDVSLGLDHTCAVTGAGDLFCWGNDNQGKIGNGAVQTANVLVPQMIVGNAKSVAAGKSHTCAIVGAGALKCWGDNLYGQLGIGNTTDQPAPASVKAPLAFSVDEVAAGDVHTCARKGLELYCFGNDNSGAVGVAAGGSVVAPALVGGVPEAGHVDLGRLRSGAISGSGGQVKMWGNSALGDGTPASSALPVNAKVMGAQKITLGYYHSCALTDKGQILCWGENQRGQLGNMMGGGGTQYTPGPVAFPLMP